MSSQARRGGWLASWALVLAVVATLTLSRAGACDAIPNCQTQEQTAITYNGLETQGWAYYCTGDHPYFWGLEIAGNGTDFSFDNPSCGLISSFKVTENAVGEQGDTSKFDATITNWCTSPQSITVTLGCSDQVLQYPGGF
jgi:hypothetical protein